MSHDADEVRRLEQEIRGLNGRVTELYTQRNAAQAEVERLTKELDAALDAHIAGFVPVSLFEAVQRERDAALEADEPEEGPDRAVPIHVDRSCECCGSRISAGELVALFVEDGRDVVAHWGPCPEPDLWQVAWAYGAGEVRARLAPRPFEAAYARAMDYRAHLEKNDGNRLRLARVRREPA